MNKQMDMMRSKDTQEAREAGRIAAEQALKEGKTQEEAIKAKK